MINSKTFDLNLVRVFNTLMDVRSVSVAATHLGLSQPSISNALSRLRRLCDDELFVRTRQGMEPTPFAVQLAEPFRRGQASIFGGLDAGASFDPPTSSQRFSILLSDAGEMVILPRLVGHLAAVAPRITLRVEQLSEAHLMQALETGGADLAIGYFPSLAAKLHRQLLFENQFVVIFRRGHPILQTDPLGQVRRKDYLACRHVVITSPSGVMALGRRDREAQPPTGQVALEVPHFLSLFAIIANSDLVAKVPQDVGRALDRFGIHYAPVPIRHPAVTVQQVWHDRLHADPANRWLRSAVSALFTASGNDS